MGGHDPRRSGAGPGALGLASRTGVGGVITTGPLVGARQFVVAVGPKRFSIGTRMARAGGVADLFGPQPAPGASIRTGLLTRRGPVLVGVGVAPGPIQCAPASSDQPGRPFGGSLQLTGDHHLFDSEVGGTPFGK